MIFEKKTSTFFHGTGYRLYSDHEIKILEWHAFVCWQWNSREWRRLVNVNCEHAHNSSSKWARPGDRLHCAFQVPSRARPGPSLPLPIGLGPPESSTGPSTLNTFTLPTFLPGRTRPGSSPLDLWQCKRGLCVQIGSVCVMYICMRHAWIYVGRKEGNVLFNDALKTFYLRLYGVRHMVKDHSDSERGNPLPPHGLLFPTSSKGSFICIITQAGWHIPRPLLHQSWSSGWNEK